MLCDPRLYSRPYGRLIRASLPPMRPTRDLQEVEAFFVEKTSATIARSRGETQGQT
jgi:hypothetical protein